MKNFRHTIYMALFLMTFSACHKGPYEQNDNSIDVQFPYSSYIFFNASQATKGEMIFDDLKERTFAVTAYKYSGEWGVVSKGTCLPNVFWNFPVTYESGAHVYDATTNEYNTYTDSEGNKLKLIPWEDGQRYTFYAHYPYDSSNTNPKVSSKTTQHGEPYLDFTLPATSDAMFDLMTAGLQDENNSVDNYVSLRMYHRLAAFDVYVSNNIQSIEVDGVDKVVSVIVKNVSVTFDNLMYSAASFWMNRTYKANSSDKAGVRALTQYGANGAEKSFVILSNSDSDSEKKMQTIQNGKRDNVSGVNNRSLLIIPQTKDGSDKYLKGSLMFDCDFVDQDGNPISVPLLKDDNTTVQVSSLTNQSMSFNVNKNVDAGYTYYLELAFVNGVITLRVQSAPTWDENINSKYEFN